jgi:signal transduction histidine kinase
LTGRKPWTGWRSLLRRPSGAPARPFQLTRYFTLTSLVAFAVLALALLLLELGEQRFFASAQREQGSLFAVAQAQLLREQRDIGRANLVAVHEAGDITLAHVFANALWDSHFAPLGARAQAVPVERCRRPAGAPATADASRQACIAELRTMVTALPGFADLDAPVRALMRQTAVFKIKVYDLRGLTVYSSEASQVGEDKADNIGWRAAAAGRPASELVHRNRFSAFEGIVQERDLVQSYVPVRLEGGSVAGVFEIYSDVTPLLHQLDLATDRLAQATVRNQAQVQQDADRDQHGMALASTRLLLIVTGLLVLFYLALLYLMRNAQRLIDAEAAARQQAVLRERAWHRDKMATMGAMAANISHEVGNPLAIISGLAQEIAQWRQPADVDAQMPKMIVEQTARIAAMTRRISDFASAGHESPELLDINQLVTSVCEFLAFDRRFSGTPITLHLGERLPACQAIPDHLTEALMGLLQGFEEAGEACCTGGGRRLEVETGAQDDHVLLRVGFACAHAASCPLGPEDARLESARRRVEAMGGRLAPTLSGVEIQLPCAPQPAGR